MKFWFSADFHWFHKNVIRLCNRPFVNLEDMQKSLIDNTNKLVKSDDILYVLGDDAFEKSIEQHLDIYDRIKCENIYLIPGNHHGYLHKHIDEYRTCGRFRAVEYEFHHKINGTYMSMSHYRMESWDRSHYGTCHAHGHHHGNRGHDFTGRRIDVGVDCWDYKPISFEFIKQQFDSVEPKLKF